MLSNAYIIYERVNKEHGVDKQQLLSHHDFQKSIALSWIQKTGKYSIRKRKRGRTTDSISPLTIDFSSKFSISASSEHNKCSRVTDDSLQPITGGLSRRLDVTLDHLPDPSKSNSRCSLHRFVGIETERQVAYCATCKVNLCIKCYRFFHRIADVKSLKMAAEANGKR